MKLYNRSKIADSVLQDLLIKAGRSIGANTQNVVVQVNPSCQNRWLHIRGMAYECDSVLIGKRFVATDGGWFKISLPILRITDPITIAESFLQVARHEWGHILDYQNGGRDTLEFSHRSYSSGRRPKHDSRPEELRAENYIYDSDKRISKNYFDDVILNLAIEIERVRTENK